MARDKQPRDGQRGRLHLDWLVPALLHPRLTEIELDDVLQTLAAQAPGQVTDEQIRAVIGRRIGAAAQDRDVHLVRERLDEIWLHRVG